MAKNADSEAWPLMEAAWDAIVAAANSTGSRRVANRYERSAANEIAAIALGSSGDAVIKTVLGMTMLWHERPFRFASDAALWVQTTRRVRALSQHHVGLRYDHRTGQQVRIYREITPKAAVIVGRKLLITFGGVGLQLAGLEERDRRAAYEAKQRLAAAISQLN